MNYENCVTRWFWNGTAIEGVVDVYEDHKHIHRVRTGISRKNKNEALIDALEVLKTAQRTGVMHGEIMQPHTPCGEVPDSYMRGEHIVMRRGSTLSQQLQQEVLTLERFQYRYTREHCPPWVIGMRSRGEEPPVQFASDAEWLEHTHFPTSKDGKRVLKGYCESNPTWPKEEA